MNNYPELSWPDKNSIKNRISPLRAALIPNPQFSHPADDAQPATGNRNMLIHGDNLSALGILEPMYGGQIKCIYIDPPYNTGGAFGQYDDKLDHCAWLNFMKPRLEHMRSLLADDGSIWISIDDDECHYLKVLCDEIFGRKNFINTIVWQKKFSPQNDAKRLSDMHDFILVYAKNKNVWRPNLLPRTPEMNSRYKNPDNDPRGDWTSADMSVKRVTPKDIYSITIPSGREAFPPTGRSWGFSRENFEEMKKDNRIWFGENGDNTPRIKKFLAEMKSGTTPVTLWLHNEVGHNQDAKKEVLQFNLDNPFPTPKPERLIQRILTLATNPGDLVLDCFLGSGTTAAVAHKMQRSWIGIEFGRHIYSNCYPRIKAVVDGEQGGISKSVNWQGGGGFVFYEAELQIRRRMLNEKIDRD